MLNHCMVILVLIAEWFKNLHSVKFLFPSVLGKSCVTCLWPSPGLFKKLSVKLLLSYKQNYINFKLS